MKRFVFFALLITCILGGYVTYQTSKESPPLNIATVNLNVEALTLSNTPVWLVTNKDTDLVCFKIMFKGAGSAQDTVGGTTRMLSAMMSEGTLDMDSEAFQNFLMNHQIQLIPDYDADHFGVLVRTTVQQLPYAFEVIKQIFGQLRIATDDLERNRQNMLVNLEQSKHDPFFISQHSLQQLAFKKHPYFVPIDDQIAGLKSLTAPQIRDAMTRFGQDNMFIVCAGNIGKDVVQQLVSVLTSVLNSKANLQKIPPVEFNTDKKMHYVQQPIPQSVVRFIMPGIGPQDPDYYAFELLEGILGGTSMKSRLFLDIRERRGLAYYAQTGFANMAQLDSLSGITGVSTQNENQVIQLIKDNLIRLQNEGVTEEELAFEKQHTSGSYALHFDSLKETVEKLADYQVEGFSANYVNEYPGHLITVTMDQIKKVAKRCLDTNKMIFVITGQNHAVSVQ